jgi:CRP/FNR family transcriptional regulator, cyclic AMP receptor protein
VDIDLLTRIPLFADLGRDDLAALSALLTRKEVPAHRTLFWAGDTADYFGIVQSGRVDVVQPDAEGKEVKLNSIGPGGFFGELSLLAGGPRTATVRTAADSVFLTLGRKDFLHFLERHPAAAVHMLMELGRRQRDTLQMLRSVKNVNRVMDERLTFGQRFASAFAARMGSWTFIIAQTVVYTLWVIANVFLIRELEWDPYPFGLLSLVLTAVAGYAAPIIMMSQARQSEKDRVKAELDYQVNVKAHQEVLQLHQKIDRLCGLLEQAGGKPAG